MYQKLVLLFVSFMLCACAGTNAGVSMGGKGFAEFPQLAQERKLGVIYTISWTLCSNNEITICSDGDVTVFAERRQLLAESDGAHAVALLSKDFDFDFEDSTYEKLIDKTFYEAESQDFEQQDRYIYIMEKSKVNWSGLNRYLSSKNMVLATETAIVLIDLAKAMGKDIESGPIADLGTMIANLETIGFIEDPMIKAALPKTAIGFLEFNTDEKPRLKLSIVSVDALSKWIE
ncbi:MAG: hypothetical protein LBV04_01570 [Deferribacteraceae bacterium]|jgi:hypothetical protein|nr:hypothetical protein [Deferribacteraceae bacterium]